MGRLRKTMRLLLALGTGSLILATLLAGQQSGAKHETSSSSAQVTITPRTRDKGPEAGETVLDRPSNIRVDTTMVLIPVAVTDPMTRFVTGLDRENFKLFEDKSEQEILSFSSEDAPLSVGLVFDTSGSMGN